MGDGIDGDEVADPVVLLVAVDVVDLVPWWDGSSLSLPNSVVLEAEPSPVVAPEVALRRDVLPIGTGCPRTGLTHDSGLTVSQYTRSSTSGSLSPLSALGTKKKRE